MPFDSTGLPAKAGEIEQYLTVLRAARDGVASGWVKGSIGTGGFHCARGWLLVSAAKKASGMSVGDVVIARYVAAEIPQGYWVLAGAADSIFAMYASRSLQLYNDATETTQRDVVALFDRAIARAKKELCDAV